MAKETGGVTVELSDLLTDITRDELDGALHFRHHPLGFVDALQAALAESFLLGNGANLLDVPLDIIGDEVAIAAYPALQIDKMVVVTDAPDTRLDLFTLLRETLVLTTGRFERLLGLLQAHGFFWGVLDGAFRTHHPRFAGRFAAVRAAAVASVTALCAARSLVAMGPETALTSSCCT